MPEPILHLGLFEPGHGPMVASWVPSEAGLFRLAPSTTSPLTAAKVAGWARPGGQALLLFREGDADPCGYAELNPLRGSNTALWVGHVVIAPEFRGQGLGKRFTRMLVAQGFADPRVERLVMVVFPDNEPALRCYRAVGFRVTSQELHRFRIGGAEHPMLRLEITRAEWCLAC